MPKSKPPYSPELRRRLVALVAKGRSPESLAEEFEPSAQAIRNWVRQAERDGGIRADGLTSDEKEELQKLRHEVRTLRQEREILKNSPPRFRLRPRARNSHSAYRQARRGAAVSLLVRQSP